MCLLEILQKIKKNHKELKNISNDDIFQYKRTANIFCFKNKIPIKFHYNIDKNLLKKNILFNTVIIKLYFLSSYM